MRSRQILDAVIAENKVVDELIFRQKKRVFCKLDIEKAYDHISWDFFEYIMKRMSFGQKMDEMDAQLYHYHLLCDIS